MWLHQNRIEPNEDKKSRIELPPEEVEDAVSYYLDIDEFDSDTDSLAAKLENLILTGTRADWIEAWRSWSCQSYEPSDIPLKSELFSYFCLTWRQERFIASLYDWIISYSDSLRYEKFTPEEKIIAQYIQERFPWRSGAWFFPQILVNQILNV